MNIIQQAETLKGLSDQQISSEMQHPSGSVPLYLVSSEAKRRADLRERFKSEAAGPPPTTTVQEDLLRSVMSNEMAPSGIAQNIPQSPPTQAATSAPQMPAQMPPQQQGIMQGAPSPQGLPGSTGAPRGFAQGGQVRGFEGGGITDILSNPNLSPFQKRQLHALHLRGAQNTAAAAALNGGAPPSASSEPRATVTEAPKISVSSPSSMGGQSPSSVGGAIRNYYGTIADTAMDPLMWGGKASANPGRSLVDQPAPTYSGDPNMDDIPVAENAPYAYEEFSARAPSNQTAGLRDTPGMVYPGAQTIPQGGGILTPLQQAVADQKAFATKGGIMGGTGGGDGFKTAAMPNALTLSSDFDFKKAQGGKLAELNKQADPYADQAARLAAREEDIAGDAETNKWLALARAGFGAAAGTSQYAMSNIAEGANAGLDDYAASQKDITAREDKAFDANTAMIGLQEDLKAKRTEESYKFAQGMQSAQETNNNIKIAEHNASLKSAEIQNQAAYQSATLGQTDRHFNTTLEASRLAGVVDRAAKSEESALDRKNRLDIAELPGATQRMLDKVINMKEGPEKEEYKEMINPTSKVMLRHKSDMEDLFGKAIKAAEVTLGDKLTPDDLRRVQTAYLQTPGNDPAYLPLFMAGLGVGAPSAEQSTGRPALTIKNK
jgi:hypothetical protein